MNSGASAKPVTKLLHAAARGEPRAAEELLPLVYGELRKLAQARMSGMPPGHTLQATALAPPAPISRKGAGVADIGSASFLDEQRRERKTSYETAARRRPG